MTRARYNFQYLFELFSDGALIMRASDKQNLEVDTMGKEFLLLFLEGLDAQTISDVLSDRYEASSSTIVSDVNRFLEHLSSIGLTRDLIVNNKLHFLEYNAENEPVSLALDIGKDAVC